MKTQARLLEKYMASCPTGRVEWIGLRPERKSSVVTVQTVHAIANQGLEGDRQGAKNSGSARQVTIINQEEIQTLASLMGINTIDPTLLRRNIVVSGINLHAMRYQYLQVGEAILEIGAHCHPCSRMESALGRGALLNMYGRGGYCAKVIREGEIALGDAVVRTELQPGLF